MKKCVLKLTSGVFFVNLEFLEGLQDSGVVIFSVTW